MSVSNDDIEKHRKIWAETAQRFGWYTEPFYVQVWVDAEGNIVDSVSYHGMTEDVIVE